MLWTSNGHVVVGISGRNAELVASNLYMTVVKHGCL